MTEAFENTVVPQPRENLASLGICELWVGVGGKHRKKEKHLEILQKLNDWKMKVNIGTARASMELVRISLITVTVSNLTWWGCPT